MSIRRQVLAQYGEVLRIGLDGREMRARELCKKECRRVPDVRSAVDDELDVWQIIEDRVGLRDEGLAEHHEVTGTGAGAESVPGSFRREQHDAIRQAELCSQALKVVAQRGGDTDAAHGVRGTTDSGARATKEV